MRVLFVSLNEALWGGSEVLWSNAATEMARRGHRVHAFFPYFKDIEETRLLQRGGCELNFGTRPPTRWWKRLASPWGPPLARFVHALSRVSPELIIFSQGALRACLAEIAICRDQGIPYAIINQLTEPLGYVDDVRREMREAFGSAGRIWFVSQDNLDRALHFLAMPLPHAAVIPNSYAGEFEPSPSWPTDDHPIRLALVARLDPPQKGQDILIEVLEQESWRRRDLEISFFGEGPARESLAQRCRHAGISSVTFAGRAATPKEIWNSHHGLILSSRYEGQSLSMIEAMLHGRPVIALPVGGTDGVVLDGETGFLADRIDAVGLASTMERAWTARSSFRQLGEKAAKHIRTIVWRDPGAEMANRLEALATENLATMHSDRLPL